MNAFTGRRAGGRASTAALLLLVAVGACDSAPPAPDAPAPAPPALEVVTPAWASEALREVVELQIDRDAEGLRALLGSEIAEVRARAALALASVQDPGAETALRGLLMDPASEVRLEAAFALGQIPLADAGAGLSARLGLEEDADVRLRLIEALGKRSGEDVAGALATFEAEGAREEAALALALSRAGLRSAGGDAVIRALLERLDHSDAEVRTNAAYYFGRSGNAERWDAHVARLREALDGYADDDVAAMHLLLALGIRRDPSDGGRFRDWLTRGADWRIRANAARAMGTVPVMEQQETRDALIRAITEDPVELVGVAAAATFTLGVVVPAWGQDWMEAWLLEGPVDRWATQLPMIEIMASYDRWEAVMAWSRRMERTHPAAVRRAVQHLAPLQAEPITEYLLHLVETHRDAVVRAEALTGLADRWVEETGSEEAGRAVLVLLENALREGEPIERVRAAQILARPSLGPFGGHDMLVDGFPSSPGEVPVPVLMNHLEALAVIGDERAIPQVEGLLGDPRPRVRASAARALEELTGQPAPAVDFPTAERRIDWSALEALGALPRLRLETEHGEIVVRLAPDQAPLTVETLAAMVSERSFDGTRFHRVIPNFVAQGGDFALGDGTGEPGFAIRSEFTRIPFRRGVIGMASSGKDTEGSQFFLMHSMQPHLDGAYTAFGWIESGFEALDRLVEGDRLIRARIAPGS
jgi:cyclophilin family peptidyl-prolyl cis-trans isomerase